MAISKVDIVNQALAQIGARVAVQSINPSDGSQAGNIASLLYTSKMQALMRAAHWNCFRTQVDLTLLKSAAGTRENPTGALPQPPLPFRYEYLYPPDCIAGRFILAPINQQVGSVPFTTGQTSGPLARAAAVGMPFQTGVDRDQDGNRIRVILCDTPQAQLVYTADIEDPAMWDPSFISAASSTLAAWFVNPLAMNAKLLEQCVSMASSVILQARISDGNEGVTITDHMPDWMRARGIGSPLAMGWCAPWDQMAFPGGMSL